LNKDVNNSLAYNEMEDFEAAVGKYSPTILKYCYSILCDYHEAQDVTQITFIKVYQKKNHYKESLPLLPWLYKIAYNSCIDTIRKKRLYKLLTGREASSEPSYEIHEEYMSDTLRNALDHLSYKDRALVYSRAVDGFEYAQLAKIYGVSSATLRKRYERAKNKLAKYLTENEERSDSNGKR